jgi:hypothetical protein
LDVYEDLEKGHNFKSFIHQAVLEFLESESKPTALSVYQAFFDSYRIQLPGQNNPFIDLLDVLRSYEESAATLIDKQRDHYIHSVNVFIIGLCVYAQNINFQTAFNHRNLDKTDYPFSYDTQHEEFFYRWGLASLFHDIGYPIEIIGKQISKFMNFVSGIDSDIKAKSRLEFENLEELNAIAEIVPKRDFIRSYYEKYESCVYLDLLKPIDLLAHKLHLSLGIDLKQIKTVLYGFEDFMESSGFIDHGFFSAIIVLKWYGFLIQTCAYKPEYFYYPVLDSASAILLHNFYKNVLKKPPFALGPLSPQSHPLAFLLILCDELQEWNREAYGILDKQRVQAGEASLVITDDRLDVTYITKHGRLPENFSSEKEELFRELLDMDAVFSGGFCVGCESLSDLADLASDLKENADIVPRPLMENLERLAIAIHDLYNQKLLERNPSQPLQYPGFSDLPDSLKYSNLRQARGIVDKINFMGWEIRPKDDSGNRFIEIPENVVEKLAMLEHQEWVRERKDAGWIYAPVKDVDKKISPYLVPYDQLDEKTRNQDRDAIRNIPILLRMIGLAIFEKFKK